MQEILSILGSLGFNWHVALANFVNFLIILYLLQRFFFGKIKSVIETREGIIRQGLANADEAKRALASASIRQDEILKQAEKESHALLSRANEDALKLAEDIKHKANEEIEKRLHEIKAKEERVQEEVERDFSHHAPALIAKLFAKALKKEMTSEENNALIARMTS